MWFDVVYCDTDLIVLLCRLGCVVMWCGVVSIVLQCFVDCDIAWQEQC